MNTSIILNHNNAYKWYEKNNIKVIGYAFSQNKPIENEKLANLFLNIKNSNDLNKIIKNLNGAFSVIITLENKILLAVDRARTFPILYSIEKNSILITDNIDNFQKSISEEKKKENELIFLFCGVCLKNTTLYDNIYQVAPSSIVEIDNNLKITNINYYDYKYNSIEKEEKELFKSLNKYYDEACKRLIAYLNGRTAVIPLSGGYDSRLITFYLNKNNYKNVIAYSYGKKDNAEAIISKKIANKFNIKWYFVDYKHRKMKKIFYSKDGIKMFKYFGNGIQVPIFQDMYAIEVLKEKNIINDNDVIVPGFLGDFIADQMLTKKDIKKMNIETITEKICDVYGRFSISKEKKQNIKDNLIETLDFYKNTNSLNSEINMIQIFDEYRFKEFHSKYLVSTIRNYDYHKLKWYLYYLDSELMDFWETVNPYLKNDRFIFKKFVNWLMPNIDNNIKTAGSDVLFKNSKKNIITKFLNKFNVIITLYYKHPIRLYSYFKFSEFLMYCSKKHTNIVSTMGQHYLKIIEKNSK